MVEGDAKLAVMFSPDIGSVVGFPGQQGQKPLTGLNQELKKDHEPEMIYIPAGTFWMGSGDAIFSAYDDEKPRHKVFLDDYWIGRYPVTVNEYSVFLHATCPHHAKGNWDNAFSWHMLSRKGGYPEGKNTHPMTEVSWEDAMAYCRWLSRTTGRHFCLPTEAQWEKAASGRIKSADNESLYPWSNKPPDRCLCNIENWFRGTTPVGMFSPQGDSAYGCADMAGNILEWCWDRYCEGYYRYAPFCNPLGPNRGIDRVLRGGSWCYPKEFARSAARLWLHPGCRYDLVGFRLVALTGHAQTIWVGSQR